MDSLYILIAIVVLSLVLFHFLKKFVHIIFSLGVSLLFLVGTIFGIIYLDYSYIANNENSKILVVYDKDNTSFKSVSIDIKEFDKMPLDNIIIYNSSETRLEEANLDKYIFTIRVSRDFFEKTLEDKIDLSNRVPIQGISLTFDKDEFLDIVEGEESLPFMDSFISFEGKSSSDFALLYAFSQTSKPQNVMIFLNDIGNGEIEITPKRFSLYLLKLIPSEILYDFLFEEDSLD